MTEISSTCRFGDQEIPIPNGAPKVPVKLNNTVLSVQLVCTDDNGFVKSTETYELTYEPPKMIEQGFLGSIPSEVLIGGGAVALLVLVAVGIMLSRKKDGVRSQDASQAIISEPQAISQILKDEPPESVPDVVQSPFLLPKENDFEMLLLEAERDTLAVTKPLELNEGGLNDEP